MWAYWRLILSCCAAFCSSVCFGLVLFFPGPAFPSINAGHYGFRLSTDMVSWLASFTGLFAIPGTLLVAPLMDRYGRKFALIFTLLPMTFGWLFIVLSHNVITFAIGRMFTGVTWGMQCSSLVVYLSEVAPKKFRGIICTVFAICCYSGGLWVNLLSAFMNWRWLTVTCLGWTALTAIACLFTYETPRWLVSRGHRRTAALVIRSLWLLQHDATVQAEIDDMEANIRLVSSVSLKHSLMSLVRPPLSKPFCIIIALLILQQLTGITYIASYMVDIFQLAASNHQQSLFNNANYQSSVTMLAYIFGSVMSLFFIDRFGRRVLLIFSSVSVAVSLTALGAFFYVQQHNQLFADRYLFWLPMVNLMVYVISFTFGYATIPYLLVNEMMPMSVRGVANAVGMMAKHFYYFWVVKVFGSIKVLPNYAMFWIYAGCIVVGLFFIIFYVPETKGRSLEEIQQQMYVEKKSDNQLQIVPVQHQANSPQKLNIESTHL